MPHNRPRDRDLAKQLVRELRRDADLPVVFLGMGGQSGVTIGEGIGLRTVEKNRDRISLGSIPARKKDQARSK